MEITFKKMGDENMLLLHVGLCSWRRHDRWRVQKNKTRSFIILKQQAGCILRITKQFKFHKRPQKITFQSRVNCSSFQLIAEEAKKKKNPKQKKLCISTKLQFKKKRKTISQEYLSLLGVTKLRQIFEFSSSWRLKHHLIWLKQHKLAVPRLQKPVWTLSPVRQTPNGRPYFRRGPPP